MSVITVSASTNYSGLNLTEVTQINFTNVIVSRFFTTATFAATQFDEVHISTSVAINGSVGRNGIVVNGSAISGANWTFTNWSGTADLVTFNGTSGSDMLVGTKVNDLIKGNGGDDELVGGLGVDKVYGGDGTDILRYTSDSELASGEIIDGGAGTADLLVLEGTSAALYDFRQSTITGVEQLQFEGGGQAKFLDTQVGGAAGITQVIGNLNSHTVSVTGVAIDLTNVTFTDWTSAGNRVALTGLDLFSSTIVGSSESDTIKGGQLNDTLSGQGGADFITGGAGADVMSGGEGDDIFILNDSNEIIDGESMSGGNGIDTLFMANDTNFEGWRIALSSIERVNFGNIAGNLALAGSQIGAASGLINQVNSGISSNQLTVMGPAVDLTGIIFTNWSVTDRIVIAGQQDTASTLTGSALADTILGANLDDVISGGKGVDIIFGGLGKDIITGGNQGDYYTYTSIADSGVGAARDKIMDFSLGNDIIDLSPIDAIAGGADDAFTFKGQSAFDGAGQVRYTITGAGNTIVEADIDGDGNADFQIALNGSIALTIDEFIL